MKFQSKIVRLSFIEPFEISKLVRSHQDVLRVEIHDDGLVGHGETPAIPYYGKDIGKMQRRFQEEINQLAQMDWSHSELWYIELERRFPNDSFIRSAVDAAAWDLKGKKEGSPVWKLLGLDDPQNSEPSNFTIGIGSADYVKSQIVKYPWSCYKLKLGSENDRDVLREVATFSQSKLRLDANGAWTEQETNSFLNFCEKELPKGFVELIEEPYQHLDFKDLEKIKVDSQIPFFADESFQGISDLEKIGLAYHGVNVKLDKCGGITPAVEIIQSAKSLGLKIQLGCMSSSGIGLAPAIQISSLADVVDLDAAMLVVDANFGVHYDNEIATMAGSIGMGILV